MDTRALAGQLDAVIGGLGVECLGVEWLAAGGDSKLRVYIDRPEGDEGVTVDDCEAASREISAWLDVEDPISGHFVLEVSSPGMDRPLFTAEHYQRAVGSMAKVTLKLPRDGRQRFTGRIEAVDDGTVVMDVDGSKVELAVVDIDHGRIRPDWQELGYTPTAKPGTRGARRKKNKGNSGR